MEKKVSEAVLDMLRKNDVKYIFTTWGSDHTPIIEAMAKYDALGVGRPEVIICQHEMVAMSAAHGYAQATGKPQGVLVHVDVGTANIGGAVHNAFRSRVPVILMAGLAPITLKGELHGSRDEFIHFLQEPFDQIGIVREYIKWGYELKTSYNVYELFQRAFRIANTEPKGPVYILMAREILEEVIDNVEILNPDRYNPPLPLQGDDSALKKVAELLINAENPLIITSYSGRNEEGFRALISLAETISIPVIEAYPHYINFPSDHPLHLGYDVQPFLTDSDLIFLIDTDVPWIPSRIRPGEKSKIVSIDIDPVKENIPLWNFPADIALKADSGVAIPKLTSIIKELIKNNDIERFKKRFYNIKEKHDEQRRLWKEEAYRESGKKPISPKYLASKVGKILGEDSIVLNETVTNTPEILKYSGRAKPKTYFGLGGSSLGWIGGASLGVKLANKEKYVFSMVSDGAYIFTIPTAVYWTSMRYNIPIFTVIYNNSGWRAVKLLTINQHPEGYARKTDSFFTSFKPVPELIMPAKASGCYTETISEPEMIEDSLKRGLDEIKKGRSVVIDVRLEEG
jgi:acetolactate synthase-1/2/3 large subunit